MKLVAHTWIYNGSFNFRSDRPMGWRENGPKQEKIRVFEAFKGFSYDIMWISQSLATWRLEVTTWSDRLLWQLAVTAAGDRCWWLLGWLLIVTAFSDHLWWPPPVTALGDYLLWQLWVTACGDHFLWQLLVDNIHADLSDHIHANLTGSCRLDSLCDVVAVAVDVQIPLTTFMQSWQIHASLTARVTWLA